jgi:hypothetical protein
LYQINANVPTSNVAGGAGWTGGLGLRVQVGGVVRSYAQNYATNFYAACLVADALVLAAGDQVTVQASQNIGQIVYIDPTSGTALPATLEAHLVTT